VGHSDKYADTSILGDSGQGSSKSSQDGPGKAPDFDKMQDSIPENAKPKQNDSNQGSKDQKKSK